MRKTTTTLLAPLAALAVAGTIGAGPAQAHGDEHGQYGGEHSDSQSAEIVTSEEAAATLEEAGVTTGAVEPATAEEQEDGTTLLSFPKDEESEKKYDSEVEFLGGCRVRLRGRHHDVAGPGDRHLRRARELRGRRRAHRPAPGRAGRGGGRGRRVVRGVPTSHERAPSHASYGDEERGRRGRASPATKRDEDEYDLALTAEGADALNEVAGDDAFAEGDVLASTDDGKDC